MNRITNLFQQKKTSILNIYFTAGYPQLTDTERIIINLAKAGADIIEIGMPYSDPLADGPVIQQSSEIALANGMNLSLLFEQIAKARAQTDVPLVLMGYVNQVMQYGVERFLSEAAAAGVDAMILPDLPLEIYEREIKYLFEKYDLRMCFLITPQTPEERMRKIEILSDGFIYIVSSAATTGGQSGFGTAQIAYFQRIKAMDFAKPTLIGFGISSHESYTTACEYANGAIIGSAFIKMLGSSQDLEKDIQEFIEKIKIG
jgi:tryptophan synthase alpha chain